MAGQPDASGPGFMDVVGLGPPLGKLLVELVHGVGMGADVAVATDLASGLGHDHGDGFAVDIEADVFDAGVSG